MGAVPMVVALCFLPAGVGLWSQGLQPLPLPHRLLALALGLMLMEQAHMARVDVQRVLTVRRLGSTSRLAWFTAVLAVTILGELGGFYLAAAGALGLGMMTILVSLLGFNLFANGRFEGPIFHPAGPRTRLDVIAMDLVTLGLALLWMLDWGRMVVASLLLGVTLTYGAVKVYTYLTTYATARLGPSEPPASTVHIPHTAQQHPQPAQQNR